MTSAALRRTALAVVVLLALTACGSDDTSVTDVIEDPQPASTDAAADDTSDSADALTVSSTGLDLSAFVDGALVGDAITTECTLSSGATGECYELTIAGFPANRDSVGPWCPSTLESTADEAGIWFDGNAVYDVDGEFILNLAEIYDDPAWQLYDEDGNVLSTNTEEFFNAVAGPDNLTGETPEEYTNLCVYGEVEWTEGGGPVEATVELPATPTLAATSTEPGATLGVTLDGVRLEGGAPIDIILGDYNIGVFDDCGGHVNPIDGYHMHATTGCSDADGALPDGETPLFAYALDGFGIHGPFEEGVEPDIALDACNGHETTELGYHYHANQVAENDVLPCFSGEIAESAAASGRPGGGQGGPPPNNG